MNLNEYKSIMEEQALLSVTFTQANNTDFLFLAYDGEIEIRMTYKDFFRRENSDELNRSQAIGAIRRPKFVLVKSVDEEKKIVYVSYVEAMKKKRDEDCAAIDAKLSAGEEVRVTGKVIDVRGEDNRTYAVIAFNNSNINGIVWCERWSPSYTSKLRGKDLVGMEVEVVVLSKLKHGNVFKASYVCARDIVVGDIWNGVEKKYHKGDILNVLCVERWGQVFSGSIEGESELKVRMVIPDKATGLILVTGLVYQCTVIYVNEMERKFRVRPERLCSAIPGVRRVSNTIMDNESR